jgi:hypothetical protein
MIKTLRITSVIVAITAAVLLALPAVYGVRKDPKMEEFLKKPGVVEKLTAVNAQNPTKIDNQNNPLIKGAGDFGKYLNPPPTPPPKVQPGAPTPNTNQPPAPPAPVAVKFDLVATSYYASNPSKCFVLIDEAGKGLHWVKQGSTIGHVTIETVKDGAIVVKEGTRTSEMTVKTKETWRTLLKNPPPSTKTTSKSSGPPVASSTAPSPAGPAAQLPAAAEGPETVISSSPAENVPQKSPVMPTRRSLRPGVTPPGAERITSSAPPATDSPVKPSAVSAPVVQQPSPEPPKPPSIPEVTPVVELTPEKQAEMDKLISDMSASKITDDETEKMEKLVEAMRKMEEAQNSPESNKAPKK